MRNWRAFGLGRGYLHGMDVPCVFHFLGGDLAVAYCAILNCGMRTFLRTLSTVFIRLDYRCSLAGSRCRQPGRFCFEGTRSRLSALHCISYNSCNSSHYHHRPHTHSNNKHPPSPFRLPSSRFPTSARLPSSSSYSHRATYSGS
jgi:hypothetical protein